MTPEEKAAMLAVIEGLMNEHVFSWPYVKGFTHSDKDHITEYFNSNYPCIVWHWNGDKVVVTGYEQKEI